MVNAPDTHRGWEISRDFFGHWQATGPNYDAFTDDDGEWADNGEKVDALTREALIAEIDAWHEEHAS